jgi:molybdopterin adenylyltransferase
MAENRIRAVVLSVSDTRNSKNDISGDALVELLLSSGTEVLEKRIISDDLEEIRQTLVDLSERQDVNLIMTTGGTGLGPRDNTPEATRAVIEKEAPGLAEAMRAATLSNTPFAMLSRGVCGIRNGTLIINLPGSTKGVNECFEVIRPILQHAVDQVSGHTKHD